MANKDYYQILGVGRDASPEEIKKAFHKLAHQHHPDKKGGDEAKFKEINEAYQILSSQEKRAQYDQFGQAGMGGGGFNPNDFGFDFSGFTNQGGGFEFDLGDIFGNIFSGGRSQTPRGRDISVDIQIPFADAVFGVSRKVLINKVSACDHCQGNGAEPGSKKKSCQICGGQGKVHEVKRTILGQISTTRVCDRCQGRGEVPETPCRTCAGQGVLKKSSEIQINIPAGIENGEMIRLTGQGEAVAGGQTGDLYVKVHVEPHKHFRREGANLLMDLEIKLSESLLGGERKIETLDGIVDLKIPDGTSSGEVLRIRERGVPTPRGKRGDLYVKILIKTPQKLSTKVKKIIDELKKEGL
jgi:molecular chaperone DnaJ